MMLLFQTISQMFPLPFGETNIPLFVIKLSLTCLAASLEILFIKES